MGGPGELKNMKQNDTLCVMAKTENSIQSIPAWVLTLFSEARIEIWQQRSESNSLAVDVVMSPPTNVSEDRTYCL